MPLETAPQLAHEDYGLTLHFHASVTEWELCDENHQEALDWDQWAEQQAEQATARFLGGGVLT